MPLCEYLTRRQEKRKQLTNKKCMTVEKIIQLCGGEHEIAGRLKLSGIDVVRRWATHAIPLRHWPVLIDMAAERKNKLTGTDLWQACGPIVESSES
jgi:hypothetical protein